MRFVHARYINPVRMISRVFTDTCGFAEVTSCDGFYDLNFREKNLSGKNGPVWGRENKINR